MIELRNGWLQNQTEIEMATREVVDFAKRKEDVPSREEMYSILKRRMQCQPP